MTAPNHPTSRSRLSISRKIRFGFLAGLVVIATTVLFSTSSFAGSLSQRLLASATSVIGGSKSASDAHARHSMATEFVEAAAVESTTMTVARRGHTATRLSDGRVLIAGGENSSGALNESEIYDPATGTFTAAANMGSARVDHTATLLADGRVLIAGGRDGAAALATTELFDPGTGVFTSGPLMSIARAGHSATLFANGRVFIAGGESGGNAEIIDLAAGTSAAASTMGVARSMHSAALLQDGRVLIVGGRDANGDELDSGEIFDTPASAFSTVDSALKVPRVRPHLRVLFDGKVQIIGGSNDGSMEIYDPLFEGFGGYVHVIPESDPCVGLSGQVLASQTRAALFRLGQSDSLLDRSGHTITELNGQALVLGGVNSSGTVLDTSSVVASSTASITTDKMDYSPGQTAHITGRGFQPGEVVRVKIHEDPHTPQERGFDATADAAGNFSGDYLVQDYDIDMKFIVGARGLTSGVTAQTTFTDANPQTIAVAAPTSATVIQGATAVYGNVTVTVGGNTNPCTVTFGVTPALPAGATAVFGTNPVTTTGANIVTSLNVTTTGATPTGTYTFQVTGSNSGTGCQGPGPTPSNTLTLIVNSATVNTTLTLAAPSPSSVVFGSTGPVTFSATLVRQSGGAPVQGATVNFNVDGGGTVGSGVTNASGVATFSTYNPSALNAGPHTVQASFPGQTISGTTYNSSTSGTQTLTVDKRDTLTTVSSSLNPSTFGESVTFTATVVGTGAGAGNPSGGSVQFKIDGVNFGAPVALTAGSASSGATTSLNAGNHTVEAVFTSSDTNFNNSSDLLDGGQTVNKRDTLTTVSSSLNPSTFGESVSFTATVVGTGAGAGNPTGGFVQFKIDGLDFGPAVALAGGSASSGATSALSAGTHTVEAVFTSADTNFNNSSDLLDGGQTVNKRDTLTTVSSSLNPSTFGENVTFTATVVGTGAGAGNPSGGSVQFKIDGVNFGAPVALTAGSASTGPISTLNAGNHTVEAIFTSSDTNFNNSSDLLDGGQTVNKRNTLTTVSSSLNPSTFGQSVSFSATVVGTGAGAGNPSGGSVQFKIDGADFGPAVALVGGSASSGSISTLSAANHTVEAVFTSADTNFNNSSDLLDGGQVVNKRDTLTTVSSTLNPLTFGQSVSFSATVVGTGAGAGNPSGGSVQFKIDGVDFGPPVALAGGIASSGSISTLSAGTHTVEAVFTSADTNFNNSSDLLDGGQVVNKRDTLTTVSSSLNPSTFGQSVTFTATVVGTGAGAGNPSGGSVQFKIDGANFGAAVALTAGSASSGATTLLTAGNHTVEAIFTSSDTNFNDSNDLLDGGQTVDKRNTLTTVSSTLNPSTFGQSVSFSATVVGTGAGAGNPSGGSVQFKIDGTNFGAAVALTAGSASSGATNSLTAGNHTVEAVFTSADTNFNDSNDLLDGGQVVNKRNTLTTVSSSLNPSIYGQNVTFTATVAGTGAGAGDPSGGSVQFKIDGVNFGAPVALASGSASSGAINSLTAGNHTVEAVFTSADTNFNNSSDLLDGGQTVNKASLTITASSHTIIFGDAVPTITASYSGFVLGESPSNLTTQPACSTTYTVGSLIGTYPTKCENAVSNNYNFTYVNGTVTVNTACTVFNGFLSPIGGVIEQGTGGSFANPVRAFKLNSTIPVRFNAICYGSPLVTGVHTLTVQKYSNAVDSDDAIDATPTDSATTGNQFRITGTEWHFNLNTKALGGNAQGTWLFKATLFDGSSYTVWISIKK